MARIIRKARVSRYGTVIKTGIGFGSALAMVLSYVTHESILWAIFHGILGWFYVIYFVIVYRILG